MNPPPLPQKYTQNVDVRVFLPLDTLNLGKIVCVFLDLVTKSPDKKRK
jgi:hypothetical protein